MVVLITLIAAGADTGPTFDLYSDVDGFDIPFDTEIDKQTLLDGYECNLVPDGATIIRIASHDNEACANYIDITISLFTTTTTTATPTTSTTTTGIPIFPVTYNYTNNCEEPTCVRSSGTITINGDVVYTWYTYTATPDGGIIVAQIGDTIEIEGIAYAVGAGCEGINGTLTYYIDGTNVAAAIEDPLIYSFTYNGEGIITIEKGCVIP